MIKLRLLSAVSVVALGAAFAAPAQAFDNVHWSWNHNTYTDLDAFFDINVDFINWGLTQTERLQVMAGNMNAFADGSYASYYVPGGDGEAYLPPIIIYNTLNADQSNAQAAANTAAGGGGGGGVLPGLISSNGAIHHNFSEQGPGDNLVNVLIKDNTLDLGSDIDQSNTQSASNIAKQINNIYIDLGDLSYYPPALDALYDLAKVEISATAISNIATIDGEHAALVHDGQVAFGSFNPVQGGIYDPSQDQAAMASNALVNWVGMDLGYSWGSEDDMYGSSGNRNYDVEMLAWTAAQYGLISKGYNTAVALGDYVNNAQLSVDATAAANIHTVSVTPTLAAGHSSYFRNYHTPTIESDNIAIVDLNQFGYQDTYAVASATHHTVSGFKNLGLLEAPVLKVSASALGNVSTVTNKFAAPAN